MALDDALLARARRTGEAVLRTYAWGVPTLSLGRNQRARGLYDLEALDAAGVGVVRRPTGGRALLHHHEITYSVTAPLVPGRSGVQLYARINALLADALDALGVAVQVAAPSRRAAAPTGLPCFAEPSAGELVHGERKLVGSAQLLEDGAALQHGSILIDDDQGRIPAFMLAPPAPARPPATLRAILGRVPRVAELHDALADAVARVERVDTRPLELDATTRADTDRLADRYRDAGWTWRR
jgi:lipoate-protein ligase A